MVTRRVVQSTRRYASRRSAERAAEQEREARQLAASALEARKYGGNPPPAGVSAEEWAREADKAQAFDVEHAARYVEIHVRFRELYDLAYDRCYPRTIHHDWTALRDMVRDLGPAAAYVAIDRLFRESLLVAAGIESVQIAANWAHVCFRRSIGGGTRSALYRSRLTRDEAATLRAVVREHAGVAA